VYNIFDVTLLFISDQNTCDCLMDFYNIFSNNNNNKMQRQLTAIVPTLARRSMMITPRRTMASTTTSGNSGNGISSAAYNLVFRRNITYATYIFGGALIMELTFGSIMDNIWNTMNKGVCIYIP